MIPTATRVAMAAAAIVALGRSAHLAAPPRVTIDTGTLEGVVDSTTGILVFRGIPYAEPPVGTLLWRPPRTTARWYGHSPARDIGPNCHQALPYGSSETYT